MTPEGLEQLVGVYREIFKTTGVLGQNAPPLYHYTDHAGLLGIVSNNCFWATNAKFLNDASEVKYGSRLAIATISERIERETYAPLKSALETTKEWLLSVEAHSSSIQPELTDAYVVCFCEQPNLLSQWRMYSSGGGYAVGFDFRNEKPSRWREGDGRQAFLSKVRYVPDDQETLLKGLLGEVEQKARAIEDGTFYPIDDKPEQFLVRLMDTILPSWLYTVKDPSFDAENEWRLVYLPAVTEEGYATPQGIQFRSGRIGLIPYIELRSDNLEEPKGPKLPIASVKCGPNVDPDLARHAVKLLLRKSGYPRVDITASAIPVRM
jgi:hypothetical protein